ncbi:uncharacterized protein L3040_003494 [Drepanopeziza brunnea f. sp. 'multigermtubi']|uniref:uncharacterized protein n=1 Tax=Drepanopeziza brunnea f. sp. 'multigermtubi' TaxID=698441 RepID=UPI00239B13DE|nr:hypothetical protein L3040_003494 [Drepanopeziza brunnea f. sp. 'multigermtubi']
MCTEKLGIFDCGCVEMTEILFCDWIVDKTTVSAAHPKNAPAAPQLQPELVPTLCRHCEKRMESPEGALAVKAMVATRRAAVRRARSRWRAAAGSAAQAVPVPTTKNILFRLAMADWNTDEVEQVEADLQRLAGRTAWAEEDQHWERSSASQSSLPLRALAAATSALAPASPLPPRLLRVYEVFEALSSSGTPFADWELRLPPGPFFTAGNRARLWQILMAHADRGSDGLPRPRRHPRLLRLPPPPPPPPPPILPPPPPPTFPWGALRAETPRPFPIQVHEILEALPAEGIAVLDFGILFESRLLESELDEFMRLMSEHAVYGLDGLLRPKRPRD